MDVGKIISVDFGGRRRVSFPDTSYLRPRKIRKSFLLAPSNDFLIKQKSLEGIIRILERTTFEDSNLKENYSLYSGLSKTQWCNVLERQVKNAKSFSDS